MAMKVRAVMASRAMAQPTPRVTMGSVANTSDTRAELEYSTAMFSSATSTPNCPMPIRATGSRSDFLKAGPAARTANGNRNTSAMA